MPINTDFKNMLPRPVTFGNPLAKPGEMPKPAGAPVASPQPLTRREAASAAKTAETQAFQVKQTASHQVYNSTMGQTTFVHSKVSVLATNSIDKTTGLDPNQTIQVSTDVKSGPVLPNTVIGVDTSENTVKTILGKCLAHDSDFESRLDNIVDEMATLYKAAAAQRNGAKQQVGAPNYRTAFQNRVSPQLNLEDRLNDIGIHLEQSVLSKGITCTNFSAMFFLLLMQGIEDAHEFRQDDLKTRFQMDNLKLRAKDLVKAKLAANFSAEVNKALSEMENGVSQASGNIVQGILKDKQQEALEQAEGEQRARDVNDEIVTDKSRDLIGEKDSFASWKEGMQAYIDESGATPMRQAEARKIYKAQETAYQAVLDKKTQAFKDAHEGAEPAGEDLKQLETESWSEFKTAQLGVLSSRKEIFDKKLSKVLEKQADEPAKLSAAEKEYIDFADKSAELLGIPAEKVEALKTSLAQIKDREPAEGEDKLADMKTAFEAFVAENNKPLNSQELSDLQIGAYEQDYTSWLKEEMAKPDLKDKDKSELFQDFAKLVGFDKAVTIIDKDETLKAAMEGVELKAPKGVADIPTDKEGLAAWIKTDLEANNQDPAKTVATLCDTFGMERAAVIAKQVITNPKQRKAALEAIGQQRQKVSKQTYAAIFEERIEKEGNKKYVKPSRHDDVAKCFANTEGGIGRTLLDQKKVNEKMSLGRQGHTQKSLVDQKLEQFKAEYKRIHGEEPKNEAITAEQSKLEAEYKSLEEMEVDNPGPDAKKHPKMSSNSLIEEKYAKRTELSGSIEQLETKYTQKSEELKQLKDSDNPDPAAVRQLQAEVDALPGEIQKLKDEKTSLDKQYYDELKLMNQAKAVSEMNKIMGILGGMTDSSSEVNLSKGLGEALNKILEAAQGGTDLFYGVSSYTQQHADTVAMAAQQLARMFAAMKLVFR